MKIDFAPRPTSLLGRIVFTLIALVIVVLAFFFFAVALVAGAILAVVIGARLWWRVRKLKKQAREDVDGVAGATDVVEGEYHVVERTVEQIELHPKSDTPPKPSTPPHT